MFDTYFEIFRRHKTFAIPSRLAYLSVEGEQSNFCDPFRENRNYLKNKLNHVLLLDRDGQ